MSGICPCTMGNSISKALFGMRDVKKLNCDDPEQTAHARLLSRRVETGANRTGRSSGLGYNYVVTFQLNDGSILELYTHDVEYGALREGMSGKLSWQGRYFTNLEVSPLYEELAQWAEEEHRTVNAHIEYLLTQCVRHHKEA